MTEEQNNMRTCSLFQEICVNVCTCKLVVHRCKETLQPEEGHDHYYELFPKYRYKAWT